MNGTERIAAERQRQIDVEKWTSRHDDEHTNEELPSAAIAYVLAGMGRSAAEQFAYGYWPWSDEWWRPTDRITNLTKAGALIAAEIDRIQRANS